MPFLHTLLLFLVLGVLSCSTQAIPPKTIPSELQNFKRLEYHLPLSAYTQTENIDEIFNKIKLILPPYHFKPVTKSYNIYYLDSPDRELNDRSLIFRVQQDLSKPERSKITLKSRSKKPLLLNDLPDCNKNKYEIDITGGQSRYSVSSSVRFNWNMSGKDAGLDAQKIVKQLEEKCSVIYKHLNLSEIADKIISPGSIKRYKVTGVLNDSEHNNEMLPRKITLELWLMGKDKTLLEISFKGKASNKEHLDFNYSNLKRIVTKSKRLNSDPRSKTEQYFQYFKNSRAFTHAN